MFPASGDVQQAILLVGVVALVMALLVTMQVRRQQLVQADMRRQRRERYAQLRQRPLQLDPATKRVADRLGWLVRNPARREAVLRDRDLFVRASRRALDEGIVSERELVELARAVNLDVDRIGGERPSTLRLSAGIEVSVADESLRSGLGTLGSVEADHLRVTLKRGRMAFPVGTAIDVVCSTAKGLYRFASVSLGTEGQVLRVAHSHEVAHVQRRGHRRHGLKLPIQIQGSDRVRLSTRTIDLSVGGAQVVNPRKAFAVGSRVRVAVDYNTRTVRIPGRIVRLSRGDRAAHIEFDELDETVQHVLFRVILSASS